MMYRNNKTMTFEQFVEAVKKESAELAVSKEYPEDYKKEIARWEEEDSLEHYQKGYTVEGTVYDIGLMV